jgi:hypothetical protein
MGKLSTSEAVLLCFIYSSFTEKIKQYIETEHQYYIDWESKPICDVIPVLK